MGRRAEIGSVLVIGSGPIVIGQACEFDYSGTQACRALAEEGIRVVLVNSNPATIMTDPGVAARTYIEPLEPEVVGVIIERERPDAILPTMGGQTALNLAMALSRSGVLADCGVEMIGATAEAIATAEDRELFKAAMTGIGLEVPASGFAHSLEEALAVGDAIGYPTMIRPSFILGGEGTGIAADHDELVRLAAAGLAVSPIGEILVERSIVGWKEYELEVMRDRRDNCVVVCSIENLDAMGVHTGDSITVAPAQTLSDVEYQQMRDAAFACIRRVGVETGGSNIQFAVDPSSGRQLVIEMNPRVSRSSALASKATGFPIAKVAARLAIGYTLDEIRNDITKATPACFEPTIDYVVTKVPRWAFEKLPGVSGRLGTRMQSVGEVMAIGRTFAESLQKALRGLEQGRFGLNCDPAEALVDLPVAQLLDQASRPTPARIFEVEAALRLGATVDAVAAATGIDPWFLDRVAEIVAVRRRLDELAAAPVAPAGLAPGEWRRLKRAGFSDAQIAWRLGHEESDVRGRAPRRRRRGDLQDRRHLRRGVRRRDPVLLLDLRGRERGAAVGAAPGGDPRIGSEPDRTGHRVRLLLCPRRRGVARGGLRDGDGELQPRDRLHRLRHLGPALLRADHRRGRGGGARRRVPRRERGSGRRDRQPRRPDAAQARREAAGVADLGHERRPRSTSPRTASASARCSAGSASPNPQAARRAPPRRLGRWPGGSAIPSSSGRATCSAAGRWRSSTTRPASARR